MPRLISFGATIDQFVSGQKTETRRLGHDKVHEGTILTACPRVMGFKRGEKVQRIRDIAVTKSWYEPLNAITQAGVIAEGFPDWTPEEFVTFFMSLNNCPDDRQVKVIQFEHLWDTNYYQGDPPSWR